MAIAAPVEAMVIAFCSEETGISATLPCGRIVPRRRSARPRAPRPISATAIGVLFQALEVREKMHVTAQRPDRQLGPGSRQRQALSPLVFHRSVDLIRADGERVARLYLPSLKP